MRSQESDDEKSSGNIQWGVAVGVSRTVYGRQPGSTRVRFNIIEPPGDAEWAIPEEVILRRWRRLTKGTHRYSGVRLPPGTWRAVAAAMRLLRMPAARCGADKFKTALKTVRQSADGRLWRTPSPPALLDIVRHLESRGALSPLLARHGPAGAANPERPGIPDLCLFRQCPSGATFAMRFVEVKKRDERLYQEQKDEILFLRELGLRAGMVRIIER